MTAASKGSTAGSMIFTQSEATAAQRTWVFHLVKTADQADCTGVVPVMTISKAGGAFGAVDVTTAITELTNGWYKVVHALVDFDTVGCLGVHVAVATADSLDVCHQITVFDLNTATANPAANGITAGTIAASAIGSSEIADGALTASKFGSDALAAISAALETKVKNASLAANGDSAISMLGASDCTVTVTGTFGSGSAQVQTCENPAATVPVWTNSGAALTVNGAVVVTGPHSAVRVHLTGATAPVLAITFAIRKPVGVN